MTDEKREQLSGLHGLIPDEVGLRLAELAGTVPAPRAIVEVGSYCGKSTCYLAEGSRLGLGAPVFAVDPWDIAGNPNGRFAFNQKETRLRFMEQVKSVGLDSRITAFRAFSRELAQMWTRPIGLLYIDGSHTEKDVQVDLAVWGPHLAKGAIVAFDDYRTKNNPGVEKVVDRLRGNGALNWRWEEGPHPLVVGFLP